MLKSKPPVNVRKNLLLALVKSLLVPVLLLAFFTAAPHWLNSKIRTEIAAPAEMEDRLDKIAKIDFQQVCFNPPAGFEKLHDNLARAGLAARFRRLQWGLILSSVLVAGLGAAIWAIFSLNAKAKNSPAELIHGYRLSWKIGMAAALAKVFLLIPLLAYGTFELTVLWFGQFFPKLLLVIILGGLIALWRSATILLKKAPLEFKEPMSREVTPSEAPDLWQAVKDAAGRLQTLPPDHIVIGLQFNFYVTELAVCLDSGRTEGKMLYLSYPLLKQLSGDEVLAIIGHELGHFIGEDTRMTREFYPLRLKIHATMVAMARSGWVGWPSFQFLNYFSWCFGETEQAASRKRELLADQKAAALTSSQTAANALVRFQVATEAFQRGLADAIKNKIENPLNIPLQAVVREKLAGDSEFWNLLFEKKTPHPLDSHPPLNVRLGALGQNINADEARNIALAESESAYAKWFSTREALFTNLAQQAQTVIGKLRLAKADYATPEGKAMLDQHFPEKKWRYKQSNLWAVVVLLGLVVAGCLAGTIFINDLAGRVMFAVFGALPALGITLAWKRHRHGELTLNADGIFYSGWTRSLHFQEIEKTFARRSYSNVILSFRLKEKQPPIWKCSLIRAKTKGVTFSLSGLEGKAAPTAQTILRYLARQIEPADPAVKPANAK
ncbi:MAG TPA: M48 family metallopeptidase [Verrucomicrobiae bacterium]|nr:M48 family metallopeptidase [Verrucomicrobiae bacterium]